MTDRTLPRQPVTMVLMGLWILYGFGYETAWHRLTLTVRGRVIECHSIPWLGAPRYATTYTLRSEDGHVLYYTAGATDASLERGLPIGTVIRKDRWDLGYWINNRRESFPVPFYAVTVLGGMVAVLIGTYRLIIWRFFPA